MWENNVRKIVPYTPGEQPKNPDKIKLNTNENPYPPSPRVMEILKSFDYNDLKLYPDTDSKVLADELSKYYKISPEQIFIGVGSDDVLSIAFLTFFNSEKPVFFPDITYSFYDVWADVYRIPYEQKPLTDDFKINPEDYKKENGGIIFPNPNAPTGVEESIEMIEDIIKSNPDSVVIIDEAYVDFGGKSCLSLIDKYENLLVVQTFSKSRSMAGIRIGYAMGSKKLIKYMNDVKFSINSYTMNSITQVCGAEAVKDVEYFKETTAKIISTREYSKKRLKELGFVFEDSMSNFIFASHTKYKAEDIFRDLKSRNIFVRYWNKPRINNYLRITIGTDEEMNKLFSALEDIFAGYNN
ncbi:MAG: histidinol-phosphate transaminase [Oscillospiraceae bacterium]|nr:histidinol-phosphate transaminase [Oscillospiraceae bacterium]